MATNTTNFDLVKPAGSDNYDIDSFHNGSMDKIDSALQGLGTGLAIISKNNTHGAISTGEYVYVHGHGSLAEGLYKANTNIAANGTLTSSNLTAVSGGLGKQVASLSNQIANVPSVVNLSTNLTIDHADSATIGYRTTDSTKVALSSLQGFPTGKTIVCAYPHAYDDIYGRVLWVDNSLNLRGVSKDSCTISVTVTVFYK